MPVRSPPTLLKTASWCLCTSGSTIVSPDLGPEDLQLDARACNEALLAAEVHSWLRYSACAGLVLAYIKEHQGGEPEPEPEPEPARGEPEPGD